MSELLLRIQDAALQLDSVALWLPGLIAAFMGLFLWLGGKRYSFYVIGLLGASTGAFLGLMFSHWFETDTLVAVAIGAILFAIVAVLMERVVLILLATLIFAVACGGSYFSYAAQETNWNEKLSILDRVRNSPYLPGGINSLSETDAPPHEELAMDETAPRSHSHAVAKLKDIFGAIKQSAGENKGMLILWTVLGAAIGLTLAYILQKLVMVFCCSVVGTSAIIGGVVAVILAKGDPVITSLLLKPKLTPTIFLLMVAFGCICQLLFARKSRKIIIKDEDD